jgi:hypothetical protein
MPLIVDGSTIEDVSVNGGAIDTVIVDGATVFVRGNLFTVTTGQFVGVSFNLSGWDDTAGGTSIGSISPTQYLTIDVYREAYLFVKGGTNATHFEFGLEGNRVGADPFTSIEVEGGATYTRLGADTPTGTLTSYGSGNMTYWTWAMGSGDLTPAAWNGVGLTPEVRVIE